MLLPGKVKVQSELEKYLIKMITLIAFSARVPVLNYQFIFFYFNLKINITILGKF